jgi:primosomal replication protein N''
MKSGTQRAQHLLQQLNQQIELLRTEVESLNTFNQQHAIQRFDNQLFHPMLKSPKEYFDEIIQNYTFLTVQVDGGHIEQSAFLAEKLVAQMTALQREIATQSLRRSEVKQNDKVISQDLYQKLAQYQDYRRRLKNMLRDKESRLSQQQNHADRRSVEKEIAVLEGRYGRCCQAIQSLEANIEGFEKR